MRSDPLLLLLSLALACGAAFGAACSSAPSTTTQNDAGVDATSADASDDACFPFCGTGSSGGGSGGGGGDDGGAEASCVTLKNEVETLQTAAKACDPSMVNQCNGTTQGLCCAITVTAGNDPAANAFEEAVVAYKAQCDAGCLTVLCPTVPSGICQGAQGTGTCQ